MTDDRTVADLIQRARNGEQAAWDAIVRRYAPLVWSICRRYGLSGADADDVGAGVWLRLVEHLDTIREPAALPGWLATTTRRECLHLLRGSQRLRPTENQDFAEEHGPASDEWLLAAERRDALRAAFAGLSQRCQQLLGLLFRDPPASYAEIGSSMAMTTGAIGPTRMRCLDRLREAPAIAGLADQPTTTGSDRP